MDWWMRAGVAAVVMWMGCSPEEHAPKPWTEPLVPPAATVDGGTPDIEVIVEADPGPLETSTYVPPIDLTAPEWTDLRTQRPLCGVESEAEVCTLGCFCWENPIPTQFMSPDQVTTSRGTYFPTFDGILRWDGSRFVTEEVPNGTYEKLSASGEELWTTNQDQVLHFDGSRWNLLPLPPGDERYAITWQLHATGPGEAWAAGHRIFRWRNGQWDDMQAPGSGALAGTSPSDVWVTGYYSVSHFNGARWTDRTPPGLYVNRLGISVDGPAAEVEWYVYGHRNRKYVRWTGAEWADLDLPAVDQVTLFPEHGLSWVFGVQQTDTGAECGAYHRVNGAWERVPLQQFATLAPLDGVLWAFGSDGSLARLEGEAFVRVPRPQLQAVPSPIEWLPGQDWFITGTWDGTTLRSFDVPVQAARSLAPAPDGTMWVGGMREAVRVDRGEVVERLQRPGLDMMGFAVTRDGTEWTYDESAQTGERRLFAWTGSEWRRELASEIEVGGLADFATVGDELWILSANTLYRRTAAGWQREPGPPCLVDRTCGASALLSAGANDVWLNLHQGVAHYDGAGWTTISTQGSVSVSTSGSVFLRDLRLGSGRPNAAHWDGARWEPLRTSRNGSLSAAGGKLTQVVRGELLRYRPPTPAPEARAPAPSLPLPASPR